MADKTIGDLPAASQLLTADLIPIEQGGNAKSISGQILAEYARAKAQQAAGGYATSAAQSAADAAASAAEAAAWSEHPPYIGENGNWWIYNTTTQRFADSGVDASITVDIEDITMLATDASPYVTNTGTNTDPVFHLFLPRGATGLKGDKGDTGNGIASAVLNSDYTLTLNYTNGTSITTGSIRGETGATGNGIASIDKSGTSGLVDTYTVSMTDGTSATFNVTNGAKGDKGDTGNQGEQGVQGIQGEKGDKGDTGDKGEKGDTGAKGEKGDTGDKGDKGDTGETGAQGEPGSSITGINKTSTSGLVDTYTVSTSDGGSYTFNVTNGRDGTGSGDMVKDVYDTDNAVANAGGIASYVSDAIGRLDTGVSSFNGRAGAVMPASGDYTAADVGLGNVDNTSDADKPISTATQTALNAKENSANKVTAVSSASTDTEYPSAKAVYDLFNSIVNANDVSY